MQKLCLLLLALAALLHCKTSLAARKGRPRLGQCPRLLQVVPSKMGCVFDKHCPRGHKCCVYDCGAVCVPPTLSVCPWNHQGVGLCVELCSDDRDCKDPIESKCCFNGCGHQCTAPHIYVVKPGMCGPPMGAVMCAEDCSHDGDCPGEQKCCSTTCGHACSEPC